jgi:DHA2 family methylenomycin A resistance protein-like MFS transporter
VATLPVRLLVLVATSLAAFTATLDNTVVAVAIVDLQADLDVGVSELQGVVTAYTVALAALLLTGGTLADVAGRRRVFVVGLVVFAGASAACALSTTATALVVSRAVQGAGAALVLPGSLAVLAATYPDTAQRARAVGVWAATGAAALVVGPLVGGLLVARWSWPAVFWVNVPLCAVVALVALVAPAGGPPATGRRLDLSGQLLVAVGLAAGTYAVVLAGRDGLGTPVLVAGAVSVAALAAFALVERRAPDPLLPLPLLGERSFLGATAGAFAASLAVFVLLVFLSLFLQLVQRQDALPTALRLLPLTVGLVLVAPLAGRWASRSGPRVPATAGLAAAALGLGLLALRLEVDLGDRELAVLLALCGAGLGLATAPVVTAALDAVATARSGLAAASVNVARELGGVVAVAGLGALAVARLSDDLTTRLLSLGVPGGKVEVVVDALLRGAGQGEVLRIADGQVPVEAVLQLRTAAEQSYVGSVQLALGGAAAVLLAAALAAAVSLPRRRP